MACTWWGRVWLPPALLEHIPGGATETVSGGQPLGDVCSGSASPTPHLSLKSHPGHTYPGRNLPRGQQHLPPQFLQPQCPTPSTNLSTPWPSTRFRQTRWRNGHDLGLLLGRTMDAAQVALGSVTTQGSPASVTVSVQTEHAFNGTRALRLLLQ